MDSGWRGAGVKPFARARKPYYSLIVKYTWDPTKAAQNVEDHDGVTFEEAQTVFEDPNYIAAFDNDNRAAEARQDVIGFSTVARLLFVVSVEVESDELTRIVSARIAEPHERDRYASQFKKTDTSQRRRSSARSAHRRAARRPRKPS
jgi:hypothetical protein